MNLERAVIEDDDSPDAAAEDAIAIGNVIVMRTLEFEARTPTGIGPHE